MFGITQVLRKGFLTVFFHLPPRVLHHLSFPIVQLRKVEEILLFALRRERVDAYSWSASSASRGILHYLCCNSGSKPAARWRLCERVSISHTDWPPFEARSLPTQDIRLTKLIFPNRFLPRKVVLGFRGLSSVLSGGHNFMMALGYRVTHLDAVFSSITSIVLAEQGYIVKQYERHEVRREPSLL